MSDPREAEAHAARLAEMAEYVTPPYTSNVCLLKGDAEALRAGAAALRAVLASLQAAPVAPKDVLIALVREWQEARKPVGLSAPGVGVAETYQAAVKRMAAADAALAAFDLDAPEDDETETCETCQQPITGQVVRSWDDVPLCEECAEPDRHETPEIHKALNASLAATAEIRERERSAGGVSDFHMGNARLGADALALLLEWLDAVTIPSDDHETCRAHGEEIDLCDECLYASQKRRRAVADKARALLARAEAQP